MSNTAWRPLLVAHLDDQRDALRGRDAIRRPRRTSSVSMASSWMSSTRVGEQRRDRAPSTPGSSPRASARMAATRACRVLALRRSRVDLLVWTLPAAGEQRAWGRHRQQRARTARDTLRPRRSRRRLTSHPCAHDSPPAYACGRPGRQDAAPGAAPCTTPAHCATCSGVPATTTSPPAVAAVRAQVDHPVGRLDHVEVVLDDQQACAPPASSVATPPAASRCRRSAARWSARRGCRACARRSAATRCDAILIRCASPPDSVVADCPSRR